MTLTLASDYKTNDYLYSVDVSSHGENQMEDFLYTRTQNTCKQNFQLYYTKETINGKMVRNNSKIGWRYLEENTAEFRRA